MLRYASECWETTVDKFAKILLGSILQQIDLVWTCSLKSSSITHVADNIVTDNRCHGRPKDTCADIINSDVNHLNMNIMDLADRMSWRKNLLTNYKPVQPQ